MKKEDLTGLTAEQLRTELNAEQDRLLKLKFAHAVSPIENPMRIRESRKRVARLNTELTAKS
ncbi:50S ribosomal protein L29 [Spirosoma rhododendri]|jgi:large subunit ribosomal protein L29|uniref:Large ribosomal subunit protein uL29 n=1 Tax=Spirosoma rhododendri TaxID=2728024 RepID=A0A7L5DR90_9BACT|nr:50S ribosomal protein L29 [Spirosoma rhododendri]QJD78497.1 50S ribosomal protein L29 [Spirosoma rhododendri]RYF31578.1 MAG: 50S ribosomal protein L29 [Cytophagaceae bacterium]